MSTAPTSSSSSATGHATQAQAAGSAFGQRRGGTSAAAPGDLFAQLLGMLSAAEQPGLLTLAAGSETGTGTNADGDTDTNKDKLAGGTGFGASAPARTEADSSTDAANPLAALLAWAVNPQQAARSAQADETLAGTPSMPAVRSTPTSAPASTPDFSLTPTAGAAAAAGRSGDALPQPAVMSAQAPAATLQAAMTGPDTLSPGAQLHGQVQADQAGAHQLPGVTTANGAREAAPAPAWPVTEAAPLRMAVDSPEAAPAASDPTATATGAPTAQPLPATRITSWRSTTTLAHAGAAASHGGHNSQAVGRASSHLAAAMPHTATPASMATAQAVQPDLASATVALASGEDNPALSPAISGQPSAERASPAGWTGTVNGGGAMNGEGTGSSAGEQPGAGQESASGQPGNAEAQARETGTEADVSQWTSPHVRHAQVRVGDDGESPIDIQLSVDGQAVQVSFQTDDSQIRESLARDAEAVLDERLQRNGMELGGVSVGGQGQPAQQHGAGGQPSQQQQGPSSAAGSARTAPAGGRAEAAERPATRRDDNRPLDLFV